MSSRLASLLVQHGVATTQLIANAFERQVIDGGALDTILLEEGVPEQALLKRLGEASGLPVVDGLPPISREAAVFLPIALAEQYQVAPVALDGRRLRVLCTEPGDRALLAELGRKLDLEIAPQVVLEYRLRQALVEAYGGELPARFAALVAGVHRRPSAAPAAELQALLPAEDEWSLPDPTPATGVPSMMEQTAPDAPALPPLVEREVEMAPLTETSPLATSAAASIPPTTRGQVASIAATPDRAAPERAAPDDLTSRFDPDEVPPAVQAAQATSSSPPAAPAITAATTTAHRPAHRDPPPGDAVMARPRVLHAPSPPPTGVPPATVAAPAAGVIAPSASAAASTAVVATPAVTIAAPPVTATTPPASVTAPAKASPPPAATVATPANPPRPPLRPPPATLERGAVAARPAPTGPVMGRPRVDTIMGPRVALTAATSTVTPSPIDPGHGPVMAPPKVAPPPPTAVPTMALPPSRPDPAPPRREAEAPPHHEAPSPPGREAASPQRREMAPTPSDLGRYGRPAITPTATPAGRAAAGGGRAAAPIDAGAAAPSLARFAAALSRGPVERAPPGITPAETAAAGRRSSARGAVGGPPGVEAVASIGPSAPIRSGPVRVGPPDPLATQESLRLLRAATDRDLVLEVLCRAGRAHFAFAAVFTMRDTTATARVALGQRWIDVDALAAARVPIDLSSAFRTVLTTRAVFLGRVDDEISSRAMAALGRPPGLWGALLPILIGDRAVAVLHVDRGGGIVDPDAVGELSQVIVEAARSFHRIIRAHKAERLHKQPIPLPVAVERAAIVTRTERPRDAGFVDGLRKPSQPGLALLAAPDVSEAGWQTTEPDVPPAALAGRLLHPDPSTRQEALRQVVRAPGPPELRGLLELLRERLIGAEPQTQRFAAEGLAALRDVSGVPRLIALLNHRDPQVAGAALSALVTISKQDFGTSRWRWRWWWDGNRERTRADWLVAGLSHRDAAVRRGAAEELAVITEDRYLFHSQLPARERAEAHQKWLEWHAQGGDEPEEPEQP